MPDLPPTPPPAATLDRLADELLEAHPAPTLVVDADLRLVLVNRAARQMLGCGDGAGALLASAWGEAVRCVRALGAAGCNREDACRGCVVRGSVQKALEAGAVHRARASLTVLREGAPVELCALVSASRLPGGAHAVLTLDDVTDLQPVEQPGTLELADVIDVRAVGSMIHDLYEFTGIPIAVVDVKGKVLTCVGWQDVCTRFHRVHPATCRHCIESDTELSRGVAPGQIDVYRCKNGMWDAATPILVGGHHLGNVFAGQFFFADEAPDYDRFRTQAAQYGFDPAAYLAAVDAAPRLTRRAVSDVLSFLVKLAGTLSSVGYANATLARSMAGREALAKSLREAKNRLEEADRRKDEFLAVLSHELRNPLAPIRNSIHILERAPAGSEPFARAKEVLHRQTEHLTHLVDDLLDVTRISRGKVALRRARVDVCDVVRKVTLDARSSFEQAGVGLQVDAGPGPIWIDADPTRIAQVLGNLLHNAAKFTPAAGCVTVRLAASGASVELSVRDTGVGMEPATIAHMFEPFAQGQRTLARTDGGLGLGLSLVKGLVELHGGTVEARSAGPGRGAEFVVRLPVALPAPGAPARADAAPGAARGRLLVVIDDNEDAAQSLADVLELRGHRARVAVDGRSGLALARALRPDAVVCDIGLPDIDGYAVARALRSDDALRGTRLVAVSGYAQPEDRRRSREAGFDAHVAKPPDLDELLRALGDA